MKKNRLLAFLFSFIPGAGQMYLGQLAKGTILMTIFFSFIFLASFFYLAPLLIILPVIWFYAFFDVINISPFDESLRKQDEKNFLEMLRNFSIYGFHNPLAGKGAVATGVLLIVGGIYLLFETILYPLIDIYFGEFSILFNILESLPTLALTLALFYFGFKLIRGKKNTPKYDDLKEFTGDDKS